MSIPHDDLLAQSGTSFQTEQAIREVRYGDGYGQRAVDGLNSLRKVGSLSWIPLSKSERDDIQAFWLSVGVVESFDWSAPDDTPRKWRFTTGITESNIGDKYMLSVSVQEEFE